MKKSRLGALVAAAALTLTFAGTAFATTQAWGGNGYPQQSCTENSETALWVWTGDNPTSLTINGNVQSGSWVKQGGGSSAYHFEVTLGAGNFPPVTASVEFTGDAGTLTLSHCDGTVTTTTEETTTSSEDTTTSSEETTTTSDETTTSSEETTTSSEETTTSSEDTTTSSTETETTTTNSTETETTTTDSTETETTTTQSTETETTDTTTTSQETTPEGSVEELTPPHTDAISQPTGSSTVSTGLLLVLAGILAAVLVVVPAAARNRR
jgi:hypothetical protein